MSSVFDGAIDDFDTSMLPGGPMSVPSHAAQHQKIGDALEKIETRILAAPAYAWGKIGSAGVAAGATGVPIVEAPGSALASLAGRYILIDVGDTSQQFELRAITSVTGNTVNFSRPLSYAHSAGDPVAFIETGALIPLSWLGAPTGNTATPAAKTKTAINRWIANGGEIPTAGTAFGLLIDGGYYIDDTVYPENGLRVEGVTTFASLTAYDSFPFVADGSKAMMQPARAGIFNGYHPHQAGAAFFLQRFALDGRNLANSCGIAYCVQQPGYARDIRTKQFAGLYGHTFGGQNFHNTENLQLDDCLIGLHIYNHSNWGVRGCNITSPKAGGISCLIEGAYAGSIQDILWETVPSPGPIVKITGGADIITLINLMSSGVSGGTSGDIVLVDTTTSFSSYGSYVLLGARCNQNDNTLNFVRDVQRGIAINTFADTNRNLPFLVAGSNGGLAYMGPYGMVHMPAAGAKYSDFYGGSSGVREAFGAGSPEGVVGAPVGSTYRRTDGGAGTTLYVKESGSSTTGWVAK